MHGKQIVHLWRNHDPECQCSLLPVPFKELVALFDRDEKAAEAMVEEFRHRFMTGVRPRQVAAKHHVCPALWGRVWGVVTQPPPCVPSS